MNLIKIAVNRPITVLMAVLITIILGTVSFGELPVDLFPELEMPRMVVFTEYEGAGPEEVENMVTRPVEEAIAGMSNLKGLSSRSSAGSSIVIANFNWRTDMDFAALEMRESLDFIQGFLPDGSKKPAILRFDPAIFPILQIGIGSDLSKAELTNLVESEIKNRLERIEGVASVGVEGGTSSEVEILVDLDRIGFYGIPLNQIQQSIMAENMNFSGGNFASEGRHYYVRTMGQFRNLDEIGDIVVGQSKTGPLFLRDISTINLVYKDEQVITKMNGNPVVSINIRKQSDANTVAVSKKVHREMKRIEQQLPGNLKFNVATDQSEFIIQSIENVLKVILIGGALAVFVLFLFLGSITSTLIVSTAIPISIITAFTLMYFNKMNLNMVTLSGLALGIGMMIDNAIVILENIFRYNTMGKSPSEAALLGSQEVCGAITSATLTTIVVFIPIVFVKGLASLIFSPLALTVTFSLVASLVVALTVIPLLYSKKPHGKGKQKKGKVANLLAIVNNNIEKCNNTYSRLLNWALINRKKVVLSVIGCLILSLALIPMIGSEFLPEIDSGAITITINLPVGRSIDETQSIVNDVENIIRQNYPQVKTIFSTIGGSGGIFGSQMPDRGQMFLTMVRKKNRDLSIKEIAEQMRKDLQNIPGADFSVVEEDMLTGGLASGDGSLRIMVKGNDLEILQRLTGDISKIVASVEGTREITTSFSHSRPEIQIRLDRGKAAQYGITTPQVGALIRTSLSGQVVSRYRIDGKEFNIRIKGSDALSITDIESIQNLPIQNPSGATIPIKQVADITVGAGPRTINRENQIRTAFVGSQIWGRDLGSVVKDIRQELANFDIPQVMIWNLEGRYRILKNPLEV